MVFIDGSNFYYRLKYLTKDEQKISLLDFNYSAFAGWLGRGCEVFGINYYIGAVRRQKNNQKSEKMYTNQQRLLYRLRQQGIAVILGQLLQHPDKSYHEKGVDVRIAVELIRLARLGEYDIAYLLSSDTDLVPAIEEVRSLGRQVIYVGAADSQSFGLTKAANGYLILRSDDIKQFSQ